MHESTREFPAQSKTDETVNSGTPAAGASLAHEAIAVRAYQIYIHTGRQSGMSRQHWEQAERELREKAQASFDEQNTVFQESPSTATDEPSCAWEQSSNLLVWCRGGRHLSDRRYIRPPARCQAD